MLRLFATITTLALVILATAYTALAQDGGGRDPGHNTRVSIGTCFKRYDCTLEKGWDVQGTTHGPQHVGCHGFIPKYSVHTICSAGDCSSGCYAPPTPGGFPPGYCVSATDVQTEVGCVKL